MLGKLKLSREIAKLYDEKNSLKTQQVQDLACLFNLKEFAEYHEIDGVKILSVFTSDTRTERVKINGQDAQSIGIGKSDGILFLRCEDVNNITADQIRLDGRLYVIQEAVKIGGVIWRVKLSANISC